MSIPSVIALPLMVVFAAGIYYIYIEVMQYLAKSTVRNKVIVVTDAVSGVGTECARLFHKGGARLILCGKSWDKLESLYDSLCKDADAGMTFTPKLVLLDFSDIESMPEVISEVVGGYGCVDVLIFNSSMKVKAPVHELSLEMDKIVMDTNYFGPITLAKGVLPSMLSRRAGHFLLVNSIQGKLAVPFRTSYAASKHAVQAFFDCLRAEVAEFGISVSTISHTYINASAEPATVEPDTAEATPSSPTTTATAKARKGLAAFISSKLTHGVHPADLADEILRTVSRRKTEVLLAHPIPMLALYVRSLFPNVFFSVVAAGVKDSTLSNPLQ